MSAANLKRIAILDTCIDDAPFAQINPNDGEAFKRYLQPFRPDWVFDVVLVKEGDIPKMPEDYDGYVIIGSPMSVNGNEAWIAELLNFIKRVERKKVPTFGACFGHQAIAKALGGKVETVKQGWGLGTANTHFVKQVEWMRPPFSDLTMFAAHKEQVTQLPVGAEVLGGSEHCPIGAYCIGNHVFATEYHPEMSEKFMRDILAHMDDKLDFQTMEKARGSMAHPTQGKEFGQWIANFLDQENLGGQT